MGRYISFGAEYDDQRASSDVFRAALQHWAFRPHAIGAIDIGESGTRWFLSGFGLECFVVHYVWRDTLKAPTITIDESISDALYSTYMARLTNLIRSKQPPTSEPSPYERIDDKYGGTFLSSPPLRGMSINAYDKWASNSRKSSAILLGTFALSVVEPTQNDWTSAFRFLFPSSELGRSFSGAPIVSIHADRRANGSVMGPLSMSVFTEATAWLHDSQAFNGIVNNECADVNLSNLAGVGELLFQAESKPGKCVLSVESQTFRRDYQRIERAFSRLMT